MPLAPLRGIVQRWPKDGVSARVNPELVKILAATSLLEGWVVDPPLTLWSQHLSLHCPVGRWPSSSARRATTLFSPAL